MVANGSAVSGGRPMQNQKSSFTDNPPWRSFATRPGDAMITKPVKWCKTWLQTLMRRCAAGVLYVVPSQSARTPACPPSGAVPAGLPRPGARALHATIRRKVSFWTNDRPCLAPDRHRAFVSHRTDRDDRAHDDGPVRGGRPFPVAFRLLRCGVHDVGSRERRERNGAAAYHFIAHPGRIGRRGVRGRDDNPDLRRFGAEHGLAGTSPCHGCGGILLLARSRRLNRWATPVIRRGLQRFTDLELRDYAAILRLHQDLQISTFEVDEGSWLAGGRLGDLELDAEGVAVLGIERQNRGFRGAPSRKTRLCPGDRIVVYGKARRLQELHDRPEHDEGSHERAKAEHRAEKERDRREDD